MAPIHFLLQYFNISSGISLYQAQVEQAARDDVDQMEKDVNDSDTKDDDIENNKETNPDNSQQEAEDTQEDDRSQAAISLARA